LAKNLSSIMLKRFFILCSGADSTILNTCSNGEQNTASYALYTVFDNSYIAISFGIVWGLLIFNLDRFIVSTIKKRGHFFNQLLQATPRLILATIIAVVISKPLELKIFEKEINQVLLEEKNAMTLNNQEQIALQFNPAIDELNQQITTLQGVVNTKEAEVNALYKTYISEAEGTAGTQLLGKGPVYKEKREKHDAALTELQQLKIDTKARITALETNIVQLQNTYTSQVETTQPIIDGFDGLMARVNALNTLPWLPSLFIFLLFLAIETSPIIAKLLSPKGAYDFKLDIAEIEIKTQVDQRKQQLNVLQKADYTINDKVYESIAQEEELYEYKKKIARELMKEQQEAFYRRQTKIL